MGEYQANRHLPSFRWYACILYPDEDLRHKEVLNLILENHMQFPSYLYIEHEPEISVKRKIDNNMDMHEITDIEAEELFKNKENDKFAEDLEPNMVVTKPHVHMCFKFPKAYTYNTALRTFMSVDTETLDDALLLHKIMPIYYREKYFTYMLHMDEKSRAIGKKMYSYKQLHGDTSLITKLAVSNTNFVQLAQIEFSKFICMNPNIDSIYAFNECITYLARADPVKYDLLQFMYKNNKGLVDGVLKDINLYKKYHLEFEENIKPTEKYLNSEIK